MSSQRFGRAGGVVLLDVVEDAAQLGDALRDATGLLERDRPQQLAAAVNHLQRPGQSRVPGALEQDLVEARSRAQPRLRIVGVVDALELIERSAQALAL